MVAPAAASASGGIGKGQGEHRPVIKYTQKSYHKLGANVM